MISVVLAHWKLLAVLVAVVAVVAIAAATAGSSGISCRGLSDSACLGL